MQYFNLESIIKKIIRRNYIRRERKIFKSAFDLCHKKIKCFNTLSSLPKDVEEEWLKQYRVLDKNVDIASLRIYSHYVDNYMCILPQELCQTFIIPVLNPIRFNTYYADKNNLDIILPLIFTTDTILRKINGIYKDKNYAVIQSLTLKDLYKKFEGYNKLIIKPSYKTYGGKSVCLITKESNKWILDGKEISISFLDKFNSDFIIQDCLTQSKDLSLFCKTSVNTMRIVTYRSVVDNEILILAAILRIGNEGCNTDNLSSGGKAVRINTNGTLANELFDTYGNISYQINGINFSNNNFTIPNYDRVKIFAKEIAKSFNHHHLLALDIALNSKNEPVLIEANISRFSIDVPYFAHFDMFGNRTNEVINFVLQHKNANWVNINI